MHQLTAEHPSREQLLAYGRNALGEGEAAALETHVSSCVECWRVIAALPEDPLLTLLRETHTLDATPPVRLNAGYELGEQIGQGGMGVVYKARQVELRRVVALKRIQTLNCNKPETLQRFRREAEAIARLDHPHIVRVFEVGEQDGQPYLALELIEGGTLRQRLAGQPLMPADAARLVEQLARAIQHAHERGIVHRDLKPANVLLAGTDLTPKIRYAAAHQLYSDRGDCLQYAKSSSSRGDRSYGPRPVARSSPPQTHPPLWVTSCVPARWPRWHTHTCDGSPTSCEKSKIVSRMELPRRVLRGAYVEKITEP